MMHFLGWPAAPALVFSVLIAATDPIAVIAMFKDVNLVDKLMDGVACGAFLGDKAFDANKVREFLARNGAEAVIPPRKGTKGADSYDREKYKWRHLIENFFCRIKAFRRIATRYDKTDTLLRRDDIRRQHPHNPVLIVNTP